MPLRLQWEPHQMRLAVAIHQVLKQGAGDVHRPFFFTRKGIVDFKGVVIKS